MKIRPLFNRYQNFLLAFANTKFGKNYINIGKHPNFKVVGVSPDGIHYQVDKKTNIAIFHSGSPYLKKFRLALEGLAIVEEAGLSVKRFLKKPEWVIPHFQDLSFVPWLPSLSRKIVTYYPDADPESTSVDGRTYSDETEDSWANTRADAGNTAQDSGNSSVVGHLLSGGTSSKWRQIGRGFYLFDTSSIPDSVTVSAATLSLYGTAKNDNFSLSVAIVAVSTDSNTALITADHAIANFGSTRFATDMAVSAFNASGYNDFALNASGITNVDKTGISDFGTLSDADLDNSEPSWAATTGGNWSTVFADNGSNEPKLAVTYPFAAGNPMFFGGGVAVG